VKNEVRTKLAKLNQADPFESGEGERCYMINDPLPPLSCSRGIRSEIRVGVDGVRSQGSQEVRRTEARGGESRATGGTINAKILKRSRKIERLERELRELKNAHEGFDQQRFRRQRSRSRSGSCVSSHCFPKRPGKDHRAQKSSRRSRLGEKVRRTPLLHKSEEEDHNPVWKQLQ
jgi:hypothetical protein